MAWAAFPSTSDTRSDDAPISTPHENLDRQKPQLSPCLSLKNKRLFAQFFFDLLTPREQTQSQSEPQFWARYPKIGCITPTQPI
jgi:hypothetical protein